MLCQQTDLVDPLLTRNDAFVKDLLFAGQSVNQQPVRNNNNGLNNDNHSPLPLECPYCGFNAAASNASQFLQHPVNCTKSSLSSSASSSSSSVYQCLLFWCSQCASLSTDRLAIANHCLNAHDRPHPILQSPLTIQLASPIFMDQSSSSHQPPTRTGQLTLLEQKLTTADDQLIDGATCNQQPLQLTVNTDNGRPQELFNGSGEQQPPVANHSVWTSIAAAGGGSNPMAALTVASLLARLGFPVPASAALCGSSSTEQHNDSSLLLANQPSACKNTSLTYNNDTLHDSALGTSSIDSSTPIKQSTTALPNSCDVVDLNSPVTVRGGSDETISFPFDESKFRHYFSNAYNLDELHHALLDTLVSKMRQFSSYIIRLLGKENNRRIPVCPVCNKVFTYGLGDFKRHLLSVHLETPRPYLKDCLRFTYLPKSEGKFQQVQDQLTMNQMRPCELGPGRRHIPLPYSINMLRHFTSNLSAATREQLEGKMQEYKNLSATLDSNHVQTFACNHCNYSTTHTFTDLRKHMLGVHCAISAKHFRCCLQASRLDPVDFTLLSDDKLARHAKTHCPSHSVSGEHFNQSPLLSHPPSLSNGFLESSSSRASITSFDSDSDNKTQESSFTSPDARTNFHTLPLRVLHSDTSVVPITPLPSNSYSSESPIVDQSHDSSVVNDNDAIKANSSSFDLTSLPSIAGLEGADRIHDLHLPFSEPVLRQLMLLAGASEQHADETVDKMHIYESFVMVRICRHGRTIAFRCPCGRLFITQRLKDSKIRPATLADTRRHVMGVHARIPHEFVTICCQASRIARDHDFNIYPDDMLLRLAMDRVVKLKHFPPCGSNSSAHRMIGQARQVKSTSVNEQCPNENLFKPKTNVVKKVMPELSAVSPDSIFEYPNPIDDIKTTTAQQQNDTLTAEEREQAEALSSGKKIRPQEDTLQYLKAAQSGSVPGEEVERLINLPYSVEALRKLVQGYCPPAYFPVLEDKMNSYSDYKVFITRRRGRRYFCCSGCQSSSPHGMGDIRKHILGVHAKVPERYKAAAMHCSRLSREDNALLPDSLLLHLAKMKWKGTVIKPLSEMGLNFMLGSRRSSGVCNDNHQLVGGEFASQVYQPATAAATAGRGEPIIKKEPDGQLTPLEPLSDLPPPRLTPVVATLPHVISASLESVAVEQLSKPFSGTLYICSQCHFVSLNEDCLRRHIVTEHVVDTTSLTHICSLCLSSSFADRCTALSHHNSEHPGLNLSLQPDHLDPQIVLIQTNDVDDVLGAPPLSLPSSVIDQIESSQDSCPVLSHVSNNDELPPSIVEQQEDDLLPPLPKLPRLEPVDDPRHQDDDCPTSRFSTRSSVGSSRRKPNKLQLIQRKSLDVKAAAAKS